MLNAFAASSEAPVRRMLGIGPGVPAVRPEGSEWQEAGHPSPTEGSVAGARRALDIAAASHERDLLVVLLSGGGSALMALPADGVSLEDKARTAKVLMEGGADIHELNTVRKHLSRIKGGQLAAAAKAQVMTLVLSDVVGDDLSVIASGPTVPDASTFGAALEVLARRGGVDVYPAAVVGHLRRGDRGEIPETPKPGTGLQHARSYVIGPQRGAIAGARDAAQALGYHVHVIDTPVTGEARRAAVSFVEAVGIAAGTVPRPACIISAGETTVTVTGRGRGGRNQEFALALASRIDSLGEAAAASVGTDGIDGPTDAAGAIIDATTLDRAAAAGLDARRHLDDNDSYTFFDRLGDLVRTGPTDTNVGDLQVVLLG